MQHIGLALLLVAGEPAATQAPPQTPVPIEQQAMPDGIPSAPPEYQGDNIAVVGFFHPRQIDGICRAGGPYDGRIIYGCTEILEEGRAIIVLPNPCFYQHESYARLTCHELGHVNGWRHE